MITNQIEFHQNMIKLHTDQIKLLSEYKPGQSDQINELNKIQTNQEYTLERDNNLHLIEDEMLEMQDLIRDRMDVARGKYDKIQKNISHDKLRELYNTASNNIKTICNVNDIDFSDRVNKEADRLVDEYLNS